MQDLTKHSVKTINTNGINYSYVSKGKGETIFLLHGFPDTAGTWDSFIDVLSEKYHCIAPFLRGYYPTEIASDSDYSVYTIAKDINGIAEGLNIKNYSIIGHDWGASIAYAMINMFPVNVNNVCAIGMPHPRFLKPSIKLLFKARHILLLMNGNRGLKRIKKDDFSYIETLYNRWSPNWNNYNKNLGRVIKSLKRSGRVESAIGYYKSLKNQDPQKIKLFKSLPSKEVLVLVGEKDGTIDLNQFNKMQNAPNSIFNVIKHSTAGHFLHQEDELFCLTHILDFFEKHK